MPSHFHRNPFPKQLTKAGDRVVDELCRCGALRTEHADSEFEFGHGLCPYAEINVVFTWFMHVWETSDGERQRLTMDKLRAVRDIEAVMEDRVPETALAGLTGMTLGELRATAEWMKKAKRVYQKAAAHAAMQAVSTTGGE